MKRIITSVFLALLVLGFFPIVVKAQAPVSDQIEANNVSVTLTDSKAAFKLSGSPAELVAVFGKPVSTSNAFSEAGNTTVNRYNYKDLELYFEGDKLFALKVKGPAAALTLKGKTTIKTGDHISVLGTLFPNSYTSREDGQLLVGLKLLDSTATDTSIAFVFDATGTITEIVL